MAHTSAVGTGKWTFTDLTDFAVDAWEPSHDTELWKRKRRLHLLCSILNKVMVNVWLNFAPQPVYVLEMNN